MTSDFCGYIVGMYTNPQADQYIELGGRGYSSQEELEQDVLHLSAHPTNNPTSGFEFVVLDENREEILLIHSNATAVEEYFAVSVTGLIADGELRDLAYRKLRLVMGEDSYNA